MVRVFYFSTTWFTGGSFFSVLRSPVYVILVVSCLILGGGRFVGFLCLFAFNVWVLCPVGFRRYVMGVRFSVTPNNVQVKCVQIPFTPTGRGVSSLRQVWGRSSPATISPLRSLYAYSYHGYEDYAHSHRYRVVSGPSCHLRTRDQDRGVQFCGQYGNVPPPKVRVWGAALLVRSARPGQGFYQEQRNGYRVQVQARGRRIFFWRSAR